jgi:hypothetical protein
VITHVLQDDDGGVLALCGDAHDLRGNTMAFVEAAQQVLRDIRNGYRYRVRHDSDETEVVEVNGVLGTASGELDLTGLPSATADGRPWKTWYELSTDDAVYYARSRDF